VNSAYFVLPGASIPPQVLGLANGTELSKKAYESASPTAKSLAAQVIFNFLRFGFICLM
jgi:hypothetical protein